MHVTKPLLGRVFKSRRGTGALQTSQQRKDRERESHQGHWQGSTWVPGAAEGAFPRVQIRQSKGSPATSEEALKEWRQLVLILGNQLQQVGLNHFQPSFVKRMSTGMTARRQLFWI